MSETADDDASSLDALLGKYGSSGRSLKLAEAGELSTDDRQDLFGHQEEPSSQFLLEIRERAKILSRNAAKSRKVALQNVVNEGSQSTSEGASLDLFVDIIRSTAIPDETVAPSTSSLPPSNEEDLTPYTGDDLLQPVVPLDTAPWNTAEDDSLNTSQSYYQGVGIKPWGETTEEVCDDANEDSDSSSEESQDSDSSEVDGAGFATTSRHIAGDLLPEMDKVGLKSDLETYEDDKRGVEDSQHVSNQPLWQAEAVKDSEMATLQAREEAAARKDKEDIDRDDDEEEQGDDCREDGNHINDEVDVGKKTRCHADCDRSGGQSNFVEDVSPLGSTKMSRDENTSEEEDKMKNALSNQQSNVTPDVCDNFLGGISVNNADDEGTEDQSPQLLELSEDDEHDATTVQQRVSAALDDMLGEVFREERIPQEDEGDGGESDLRPRSPVPRHGEDIQEELQSPDKTSLAQEEPCATRQDESVSDVISLKTKSYSSQQVGNQLEGERDKNGDHLSSKSLSPSRSLSSRNHSKEKTPENYPKESTEMESKDCTDFVQVKETNLTNEGQKAGPTTFSHSPRLDEATVKQLGFSEMAEPRRIEHSSSKISDATTKIDLRDQNSKTMITGGSLSLPQSEADASTCSADAVSAPEKQPVISKSGQLHAKVESLPTSRSQDMPKPEAGSDVTTRKSDRPPILLGETKRPHKQERKWSPRTDDPSSSPQSSQTANHGRNLAVSSNPIRCRQWGQSGPRESKPASPDVVPERRDGTPQDVEEPKGPGNVRGLIARFNGGSVCSSPVESPRGERVQAFDWNTFPLRGKLKTAGRTTDTGIRNHDEKMHSSQQHQDRNSSDEGTVNSQDIPWMQELRERRKRREQGAVRGKAPP